MNCRYLKRPLMQILPVGAFLLAIPTHSFAGSVFEVIELEADKGAIELEALSGIAVGGVEPGDERSAHEFAIGYGIADFWKFTFGFEVANPRDENAEVEAFEIENLFLLPFGANAKGKAKSDDGFDYSLGFYSALEISREEGLDEGELALGPVFEAEFGALELTTNTFLTVPFENGEDPGFAYAVALKTEVNDAISLGFEAHG